MKKSYLMIAAATALFAACASNDTFKEVEDNAVIGFGHSATEKATRAELDMTWFRTLNNAFGVYGYKNDAAIFTNENVYCSYATAPYFWSHNTIRFWDKAAANAYDFYAYAPFTGTTNTAGTNPTFSKETGFTFTGIPVIADITDVGADKAVANAVLDIDYDDARLHKVHQENSTAQTVPTVQFIFNHILSKLSFKIKTDVLSTVATFTVKKIEINFPTATGVQWAETASNDPAGETTYTGYTDKAGDYDFTVFEGSQAVNNSAAALTNAHTYIVTPVNSTVTKHEFDVKVTYDILYADNTAENGCIATGTIGTGTPAENTYTPAQNQYYIAVININPEKIEFCVEGVEEWDPITETEPIDVK